MVRQSRAHPVPLLMTRPKAQGARFAADLRARFGHRVHIFDSPLIKPRFLTPAVPNTGFTALILTSETGVEGYRRLSATGAALPQDAFCVGDRTAEAAMQAGLRARSASGNAVGLIALITGQEQRGPLLHLRGQDARGDVVEKLNLAGIETYDLVVYAQDAQLLTAEAISILHGRGPVLLPLFSPRTAEIFASQALQIDPVAPLFVAALSGEVAKAMPPSKAVHLAIAARPDAAALLDVLADLLLSAQRA